MNQTHPDHSTTNALQPALLRPEQAGQLLSLSRATIYKLIGTGELASISIGRARRIPRSAVDSFVTRKLEESQGYY